VFPTSGAGLSYWVFRIEGGQVWWLLGQDRVVSTEGPLEQGAEQHETRTHGNVRRAMYLAHHRRR